MKDLFDSIDLARMRPADSIARRLDARSASMRVLATSDDYLVYIHEAHIKRDAKLRYAIDSAPHQRSIAVELPKGAYNQSWLNTKTGTIEKRRIHHAGGERIFNSPIYSEDLVLRIRRIGSSQ